MRALRPWLLFAATLGLGVAILGSPSPTHGEEPAPDAAALEVQGDASAEPGAALHPVVTPGGIPVLEQAWFTPAYGLPERAKQVRGAADRIGIENLDAAARAVVLGKLGDDRREEAEAAVLLAPDLPLAHAALAQARWAEQDTVGATAATLAALWRSFVHLEAMLWTSATAGMRPARSSVKRRAKFAGSTNSARRILS